MKTTIAMFLPALALIGCGGTHGQSTEAAAEAAPAAASDVPVRHESAVVRESDCKSLLSADNAAFREQVRQDCDAARTMEERLKSESCMTLHKIGRCKAEGMFNFAKPKAKA